MSSTRTSVLVVAARGLLLSAALALAASGLALAFRGESRAPSTEHYVCSMHAEVTAVEPGQCPICKMALSPRGSAISTMVLEQTETRKRSLSQPSGGAAASSRFGPGATWLPETAPPELPTRPDDPPALGAAKRRVFTDHVAAPAWLEASDRLVAVLYRDELVGLSPGDRGTFRRATAPRDAVAVKLADQPPAAWDDSTALVRFSVDPPGALVSGETGWLELPDRARELLVVPESALLRSAEGPYVLVPQACGGGIERRRLQIGRTRKGQVTVLAGLKEGEPVVISGAFFFDVEAHAEAGPEPLAGGEP